MGETLKHWLRRYLDEGGVIPEWANFVAVLPGESVVWAEKAPDFEITESETRFDSKGGLVSAAAKGGPWTGAPEVLDLNEFWSDELSPKLDFPEQEPAVPEGTPASDHNRLPVGWFEATAEERGVAIVAEVQAAHDWGCLGRDRMKDILSSVGAPRFPEVPKCLFQQTKVRLAISVPEDTPLNLVALETEAFAQIERWWTLRLSEQKYQQPQPVVPEGTPASDHKPAVPEGTTAADHKPLPVGWFQWSPATRGRNLIDTATKAHRQGQIDRARLEVILELVGAPTFPRIQYCEYLQTKARLALDVPLDTPLDSVMLEQKAFSEIKRYWESLRDEGEYKSPEPPSDLPCPPKTESPFSVEPGYERLAAVFQDAHDQAALGKGKDRHANGEPFHEQRMQKVSRTQGNAYGMAFQVQKKMLEGLEMADRGACRRELLGALNYLAGIVIFLDDQEAGGDE